MKNKGKLIIISIIAISLFLIGIYYSYQYCSTYRQLQSAQADLSMESQRADVLESELNKAQTIITDLKSEEYEFYYMGKFLITNYCSCEKCCGYWATIRKKDEFGNPIVYTASGTIAKAGRTIAVDTSVIPYDTEVYIPGYGILVAEDCGGGVKGNHIDIYHDNHDEARSGYMGYKDLWILVKKS